MQTSMNVPDEYLRRLGERGDGAFGIATAALMLAALDRPRPALAPYLDHLTELEVSAARDLKLVSQINEAVALLAQLLNGRYGYDGDPYAHESAESADLMATIDRRRGLPVTLGILYLHAARAGGLQAEGLNTPGHFLLRVGLKGEALILDPYNGGALVARERLGGPPGLTGAAPGEPAAGDPVGDVDVLLRLLNNQKIYALKHSDRARALVVTERMVLIAPRRAELWFDVAQLQEAQGSLRAAKHAYETVLKLSPAGVAPHNEAALALAGLRRRLN